MDVSWVTKIACLSLADAVGVVCADSVFRQAHGIARKRGRTGRYAGDCVLLRSVVLRRCLGFGLPNHPLGDAGHHAEEHVEDAHASLVQGSLIRPVALLASEDSHGHEDHVGSHDGSHAGVATHMRIMVRRGTRLTREIGT